MRKKIISIVIMNQLLSQSEQAYLRKLQRSLSDRHRYIQVTVILLLDKGRSAQEVAEDLGIDDSTVYRYKKAYESEGLENYLQTDYKGKWGLLSSIEISNLRAELNSRLFTTSQEVALYIKKEFGHNYSPSGVIALLHRIGYVFKQTTQVPCEADAEKQSKFITEILPSILESKDAVVYFCDGVHPTHNSRSTCAWIEKGEIREQASVSGRDRININGALNAKNITEVLYVEGATVNAQSTQSLYEKMLATNPEAKTIYVIQDNARYYKNTELQNWLEDKPIKQVFLPPYSPNLNLIERLWKFMRKKIINVAFYRTKEQFRQAVRKFLDNIPTYEEELVTLLTLNFRTINSQFKVD
jgi:transposase